MTHNWWTWCDKVGSQTRLPWRDIVISLWFADPRCGWKSCTSLYWHKKRGLHSVWWSVSSCSLQSTKVNYSHRDSPTVDWQDIQWSEARAAGVRTLSLHEPVFEWMRSEVEGFNGERTQVQGVTPLYLYHFFTVFINFLALIILVFLFIIILVAAATSIGMYKKRGRCRNEKWAV